MPESLPVLAQLVGSDGRLQILSAPSADNPAPVEQKLPPRRSFDSESSSNSIQLERRRSWIPNRLRRKSKLDARDDPHSDPKPKFLSGAPGDHRVRPEVSHLGPHRSTSTQVPFTPTRHPLENFAAVGSGSSSIAEGDSR